MAGAALAPRALLRAAARPRHCSSPATSRPATLRRRHFFCQSPNWTPPTSSSPNVSPWRAEGISQLQPRHRHQRDSRLAPSSPLVPGRRAFSSTPASQHGHVDPPKPGEELHVTFVDKDGQSHEFEVAEGDNLLDIAQANDLDMEGACGGSCACSTCHVIVESDHYDKMDEPDDDENDMLDLAFGLTETSRLGCQVKMSKDLDGLVVKLPSMTRNLQASDFK